MEDPSGSVGQVNVTGKTDVAGWICEIGVKNVHDQWHQLNLVKQLVEALCDPRFSSEQGSDEEALAMLEDVLSSFFSVLERLEIAGTKHLLSSITFETHLMWHAVFCEMKKDNKIDFDSLNVNGVFLKFSADLKDSLTDEIDR